jgi:hypothetical protein
MIPDYSHLTHDQLLRVALQKAELTDEARLALEAGLGRRKISSGDISGFAVEEKEANLAEEKVVREVLIWGIGKKLNGKRNYFRDSGFRIEEFDRTLWFVLFFIPVAPLGTFRIRRRFRRQVCASDRYRVARLPLDRRQIIATGMKTILILLFLFVAFPYLLTLTYRPTH